MNRNVYGPTRKARRRPLWFFGLPRFHVTLAFLQRRFLIGHGVEVLHNECQGSVQPGKAVLQVLGERGRDSLIVRQDSGTDLVNDRMELLLVQPKRSWSQE